MEKTGITRRIDDLGRIVIPKEIRKNLKIRNSDEIEISVLDNKIVLSKYESLEKDMTISKLLYSIGRYLNKNILFTSKDKVIDYFLINKKDLLNKELNKNVINIILNRKKVINNNSNFALFDNLENISYIINPLIINGDLIGSLILYSNSDLNNKDDYIIELSKLFLENYLE